MDMKLYRLTNEDREADANAVKDALLIKLRKNGVISPKQEEELSITLAVMLKQPHAFSRFAKKLMGKEAEEFIINIVEVDTIIDHVANGESKKEE